MTQRPPSTSQSSIYKLNNHLTIDEEYAGTGMSRCNFANCEVGFRTSLNPQFCYPDSNGTFIHSYGSFKRKTLSPCLINSPRMVQMCIQYSSLVLLYYDYFLTLPKEVRYMWGQRFRFSTFLYVFCRYALITNILYMLAITGKLSDDCDTGYLISSSLSVVGRACVITVWVMRTYAVYGSSRLILAFFGTLGFACVFIDVVHVPTVRCPGHAAVNSPIVITVLALLIVILESSLAVLTIGRCAQALWYEGNWRSRKDSINFLVFEQSVLYFGTVFGFTLTALILDFVASSNSFIEKLVNALTLPISGLMTARFLLRLREWEEKPVDVAYISMGNIEFTTDSSVVRSAFHDFGEDPVQRVRREFENSGTSRHPGSSILVYE